MRPETADAIAEAGSRVTYAGAATSVAGWIGLNEIVAIAGLILAIAGFALNWRYKHLADQRERERHAAEMRRLQEAEDHGQ